jgi:dTDP-4-amino-4,6-dideoxygalactose transaminase
VAEDAYLRLLSLPMWHGLPDEQIEAVVAQIAALTAVATADVQ